MDQLTDVLTAISHPSRRAIIGQLANGPARFLDIAEPFDVALNAVTKHRRARTATEQSQRLRVAAPLHISKVMLIDPHSDKPTRVGRRIEDGKLVRYAKASNEAIDVT